MIAIVVNARLRIFELIKKEKKKSEKTKDRVTKYAVSVRTDIRRLPYYVHI